MNLNKAFVLGNLTRDPEKRSLPSGQMVVSFGIATNRFWTDQNQEKKQETEFHNVTMFGRLAEIASQYLNKGSLVLIEGRLRTNSWQDSSGVKHFRTEIIAERMQLGPKGESRIPSQAEKGINSKNAIKDEDIPVIEEDKPSPSKGPQESSTEKPLEDKDQDDQIDVSQIPF